MNLNEVLIENRVNTILSNPLNYLISESPELPISAAINYTFNKMAEEMPTFTRKLRVVAEAVQQGIPAGLYPEYSNNIPKLAAIVMGYGDLHNMVANNTKQFFGKVWKPEELEMTSYATAASLLRNELKGGITNKGKNIATLPAALLIANLKGTDPEKYKFEIQLNESTNIVESVKVKVKHPGILKVPANKNFWQLPLKHYINLAKKLGKGAVMKALVNLERWNKKKNPDISKRARKIIDGLKRSRAWDQIEAE